MLNFQLFIILISSFAYTVKILILFRLLQTLFVKFSIIFCILCGSFALCKDSHSLWFCNEKRQLFFVYFTLDSVCFFVADCL